MKLVKETLLCMRYLGLFVALFWCGQIKATHIIGGEIYYDYVGVVGNNVQYKMYLKVYRDCDPIVTGTYDNPLVLTVFYGNGALYDTVSVPFPPGGAPQLPIVVGNPCLIAPPNICTQEAIYVKTLTLPKNSNGYVLTYERCCRNAGIVNLMNAGDQGATYTVAIPPNHNAATNKINSSPRYKDYPPMVLCLNDNINIDHAATDPDGDSLVYELCDPYMGGGKLNNPRFGPNSPIPIPAKTPPYNYVTWTPGYSSNYPMDGNPAFQIDPVTGRLTGTPNKLGKYVVAVCVKEYRNGVLLSENKRDFQFTVTTCQIKSVAAAASQTSFCEGLTVNFTNQSSNAWYYAWDFGDPLNNNDTSSLPSPSYTYSDTGKYLIRLIANPGYICADTTYTLFEVYDRLEPSYVPPPGQCFDGHSFNLEAGGLYQQYAQFEWDFGAFGRQNNSFDKNPLGIQFIEPGDFPVTLTIRENGCVESYTDTLKLQPNPVASFKSTERMGCVPLEVQFENKSSAWSPITMTWQFGDGTVSNEDNPVHVFTEPGTYDVALIAEVDDICVDQDIHVIENYVRVNPLPVPGIEVDKTETSEYFPDISFYDRSTGGTLCQLFLGDGLESGKCDYDHHYWEAGEYRVVQVVTSRYGCVDSTYIDIWIRPEFVFYAPNAFTPNSDLVNDVFLPKGEAIREYDLRILDRWGVVIFRTFDPEEGWDGTHNGKKSPQDTYVYRADIVDELGEKHHITGAVTLIR